MKLNIEFIFVRGIQGTIEDNFLLKIASTNSPDFINDFAEAHNMAEQVYAQLRKWA